MSTMFDNEKVGITDYSSEKIICDLTGYLEAFKGDLKRYSVNQRSNALGLFSQVDDDFSTVIGAIETFINATHALSKEGDLSKNAANGGSV